MRREEMMDEHTMMQDIHKAVQYWMESRISRTQILQSSERVFDLDT